MGPMGATIIVVDGLMSYDQIDETVFIHYDFDTTKMNHKVVSKSRCTTSRVIFLYGSVLDTTSLPPES